MPVKYSTTSVATLSAEDTGTDWVRVAGRQGFGNTFTAFAEDGDFSFSGKMQIQARRRIENEDGTVDYGSPVDLDGGHTTFFAVTGQLVGQWEVRVYIYPGDYTSGTIVAGIAWA